MRTKLGHDQLAQGQGIDAVHHPCTAEEFAGRRGGADRAVFVECGGTEQNTAKKFAQGGLASWHGNATATSAIEAAASDTNA